MLRRNTRSMLLSLALLASLLVPAASQPLPGVPDAPGQPNALTFFGINGYFSGYERPSGEVDALLPLGPAIGLPWTREEVTWANIEASQDSFDFGHYDDIFGRTANAGYGVVGMLLTTPAWARRSSCSGSYWCPPANVWDYYDFALRTVERYDGDGVGDAPGSPRVAYWEIWNEPNFPQTWWPYGYGSEAERQTAYASLLQVGYLAVKASDPTAQVLVGSLYVWDGASYPPPVYDGLAWLGQVMLRDPNLCGYFDIMAIHPHMPDVAPDKPGLGDLVTMVGRIENALRWDSDHGCAEKPVWVTEAAWSTCPAGQGDCTAALSKTEDQQANYLLRTYAIAAARGVQHVAVFQLEDKFDGGQSVMWGGCSIVKTAAQGYAHKKAYHALEVMVQQIGSATYLGPGPFNGLYRYWEEGEWRLGAQTRFDYRFSGPNGALIDILWRPDETNESLSFPVAPGYTTFSWVQRDGQATPLTPSGGYLSVTINGTPGYLRQELPPAIGVDPIVVGWITLPGENPPDRQVFLTNLGGGTLNWTAAVVIGGQYFSVEPVGGTAPSTLTIHSSAPQNLGYYTGTVDIDGGIAGHANVWLWMTVVPTLWDAYLPLVGSGR